MKEMLQLQTLFGVHLEFTLKCASSHCRLQLPISLVPGKVEITMLSAQMFTPQEGFL